jgi:hypothetical protein
MVEMPTSSSAASTSSRVGTSMIAPNLWQFSSVFLSATRTSTGPLGGPSSVVAPAKRNSTFTECGRYDSVPSEALAPLRHSCGTKSSPVLGTCFSLRFLRSAAEAGR